jgi:CheY-like chemotaxis protein
MSRSKVSKSSLLIVEDDPSDLKFIHEVYKKNFPNWDIKLAESGREALKIIEGEEGKKGRKFDIISFDINLSSTANSDIWTANGITILRKAIELNACKVIIVISGIQTDDTFDWVVPDRKERLLIKTNIGSILKDDFANKNIFCQKVDGWREVLEEVLSQKKILPLLERSYKIEIFN